MIDMLEAVWTCVKSGTDLRAYDDLRRLATKYMEMSKDVSLGMEYLKMLSDRIEEVLPNMNDLRDIQEMYDLHRDVLKTGAPYDFEMYLLFMEWNREPSKKFYPPRRKALKVVVDALQDLADKKLDLLGISLPPGSGKSSLAIFYICWLSGREPEKSVLTGSHSNAFVRGAYDECIRVIEPGGEYLFNEVFPQTSISNTNAKDCRIDLGKRKRFETLQFTSVGTGNAGLYRASNLLYCDDLIPSLEVALSKDRLAKLWEQYTTDLRQRKIGDCRELHIATRWSCHDVIGRLEREYGDNNRARFIVIPAMDENDESNFDYPYGVGFSTKFYREQREIMDEASWKALYMNHPIEREGLLYSAEELQRYFYLPDEEPDAVLAVCDTKDRGTDYCAMPIIYQYGERFFVEDFICDNGLPEVVEARLIEKLLKHHVNMARFESNSAGGRIAQKVQEGVRKKGGITKITTKFSTANKETRIIVSAGYVKEHFLFKDDEYCKSDKEYRKAMEFITGYTVAGKNKWDDVVDSLSMAVDFVDTLHVAKVEVIRRPF